MIKDITLGQYFPGNSPLHKMDPRVKIILTIAYIVGVFMAKNLWSFILISVSAIFLVFLSGVSWKTILKSLKPLVFILAFTAFFNIFWTTGEKPLVDWKFITVYPEGLILASMMIVRITAMLIGTTVILTYTTSPIMLTDGLERLLAPFRIVKLPVHEFSMMMTIALRFIPTLVEETDKIMSAQKARGADFESGSLVRRAKALVPILIPLFISAFRRADDLATAMECRCYRGGKGRTKMTKLKLHFRDFAAVFVIAGFIAGAVLLNRVPTWIRL